MRRMKFASLTKPDNLFALPSVKKYRLDGLVFFLSLFLGLAGCAGVNIEGPSRLPREITPGAPLSAAVVNQFPSSVSGGGSLKVISEYTQVGYAHRVNEDLQLGFAANYEYDDFDFTGLNFYAPQPWNHVHTYGGSANIMYNLTNKWSFLLVPIVGAAGEAGADWVRSLEYGGAGAIIYSFDKDRSIGLGVGSLYRLAEVSVFPFVTLNWKFNEWVRLSTPYRASPAGPGGVELTFFPLGTNKDLRIGFGGTYLSKRFRLSKTTDFIGGGIGEYDTIPLFARISYLILPILDVNLYGGASVYNYIRVEDSRGGRLFHTHQNVAPFIGIGLSLNFEKFMGGGS